MSAYRYTSATAEIGVQRLIDAGYTGSGLIMGKNTSGSHLVQVAWLQAANPEARKRRFKMSFDRFGNFVATVHYDANGHEARRYASMRSIKEQKFRMQAIHHVVSTGDKTDLAARRLAQGHWLHDNTVTGPEDDAPLYTPRVTGVLSIPLADTRNRSSLAAYTLVGKQRHPTLGVGYQERPITGLVKTDLEAGVGLCAHQYDGMDEQTQAPRLFAGLPYPVILGETVEDVATHYAHAVLDPTHFVSIAAQAISRSSREVEETFIINSY